MKGLIKGEAAAGNNDRTSSPLRQYNVYLHVKIKRIKPHDFKKNVFKGKNNKIKNNLTKPLLTIRKLIKNKITN